MPENLLEPRISHLRDVSALNSSGSCSVSALPARFRVSSLVSVDHWGGSGPLILL